MLMIKEYWNLIGQEPFLAITWELDFSQACSFRRILMNHNNFYLTQIPGKSHDMFFFCLTMFLAILVHFCPMGIFFPKKSGSVTHNYIRTPNIMQTSFRKNYWTNPMKSYGLTEGWMDRPYFIGPFRLRQRPGVQQPLFSKWLVGIHKLLF